MPIPASGEPGSPPGRFLPSSDISQTLNPARIVRDRPERALPRWGVPGTTTNDRPDRRHPLPFAGTRSLLRPPLRRLPGTDSPEGRDSGDTARVDPSPSQAFGDFAAFDAPDELFADPRGDTGFGLTDDPGGDDDPSMSRDDFGTMLQDFQSGIQEVREGEIVQAKVVRVTDTTVILEFGFKSEGAVPREEFRDNEALAPGYEVEVLLESLEDDDGVVVLSKKKADFLRVWEKIREAYESGSPIEGKLVRKIKGGMTVDLMGVDAFLRARRSRSAGCPTSRTWLATSTTSRSSS